MPDACRGRVPSHRRIPVARQALPRVHGGFWEVYSKLREKVLSTLAVEMQVSHGFGILLCSALRWDLMCNAQVAG